jgi:NitT/TauT family transport system permease protein
VNHHAEVLRGGVWHQRIPSWRDLVAVLLVLGTVILHRRTQMLASFVIAHQPEISLSPAALPFCTLRTVMRMLVALILSLIFTFTYATLAGKNRRAEMVLIPLLDVLQSVPILVTSPSP